MPVLDIIIGSNITRRSGQGSPYQVPDGSARGQAEKDFFEGARRRTTQPMVELPTDCAATEIGEGTVRRVLASTR